MARKFTIAQLITKGRRACNQENSDLLSKEEWQDEFSSVYSDFHGVIVSGGARIFESEEIIDANGDQDYTLPADFLSELGVDSEESGRRTCLRPLMVQERNHEDQGQGKARFYAVVGNAIRLYPAPSSGRYHLVYVPQAPDYSVKDEDEMVDVIIPAGEQFFKWSLAALGAAKQENDLVGYFSSKAAEARQELMKWSYNRSLTQPRRKHVDKHPMDDGYQREEGDWYY